MKAISAETIIPPDKKQALINQFSKKLGEMTDFLTKMNIPS